MEVAASRQGDGLGEWLLLLRRGDTTFAPFRAAVVVESWCDWWNRVLGRAYAAVSSKQNTKTAAR